MALTRIGLRFLVLLAIMAFAAYNTKNNLLYLMLSLGVGAVLVSIVASWLSMRDLALEAPQTFDIFAGTPFQQSLSVRNNSRWWDAYGLTFTMLDAPDGEDQKAGSLPLVERGSAEGCVITRLHQRRGVFKIPGIRITTLFPFGLFRASSQRGSDQSLTVYPRVVNLEHDFFPRQLGSVERAVRPGSGDELFRLRDYVAGDHVHHIHWKTSAKLGGLMVREFGDDQQPHFNIAFDARLPASADLESFERLVSAAASVAHRLGIDGVPFRFFDGSMALERGPSRQVSRQVLDHLAVVEPRGSGASTDVEMSSWRQRIGRVLDSGEPVLLLSLVDGEAVQFAARPLLRALHPDDVLNGPPVSADAPQARGT